MELRYYQRDAIEAVVSHIETKTTNPCIEIPTGGGKTPIIASLCKSFVESGYRVLVLAHRKELLEQTADKMRFWAPNVRVGVVSAGLDRREYDADATIAGIQSVWKKCAELTATGKIDFLIVDEAHLIPAKDESSGGMYKTLIDDLKRVNPTLTVVGLTAKPYRLSSGEVCGPDNILNEICYRVGVSELVGGGFLSRLISKAPPTDVDFSKIRVERGEFQKGDVEEKFGSNEVVFRAASNIVRYTKKRKSVLVFCCSVAHAQKVADEIEKKTGKKNVAVVVGSTDKDERKAILDRFQGKTTQSTLFGDTSEPLKFLCNVDVLTTGFDAANVDCVVLLRPTLSPGLYYQMVGRGLRLCEGKENCLVLDFGGNMRRFGPIDALQAPKIGGKASRLEEPKAKECPRCYAILPPGVLVCDNCGFQMAPPNDDFYCPSCGEPNGKSARYCSSCGFEFPLEANHEADADFDDAILSDERERVFNDFERRPRFRESVEKVDYVYHQKRNRPPSIMVVYTTKSGVRICEWVCLSHTGFARRKAVEWWVKRSDVRPIPKSTEQALDIIDSVGVAKPKFIVYKPARTDASEKTYPELCEVEVGAFPDSTDAPKTGNPLNLVCKNCSDVPVGKHSFRYLFDESIYRIVCARCGTTLSEATIEQFDEYDLELFEKNHIRFTKPNPLYDVSDF